jgi:hypothetical protein
MAFVARRLVDKGLLEASKSRHEAPRQPFVGSKSRNLSSPAAWRAKLPGCVGSEPQRERSEHAQGSSKPPRVGSKLLDEGDERARVAFERLAISPSPIVLKSAGPRIAQSPVPLEDWARFGAKDLIALSPIRRPELD